MLSACHWVQLQTEGAVWMAVNVDCVINYRAYVQDLCAFLGDGMSRVEVPSAPPLLV
jgi:hypothetical protein